MYPNQPPQPGHVPPQPNPEYGIDYLNQISAPERRRTLPNPLVLISIVGAGLLLIIGFALVVFSTSSSPTSKVAALNIRFQTLQKLASDSQKTLRDNDLRSTNAALSLYLSNTLRDISSPVTSLGAASPSVTKPIATTEATYLSDITTKLDDAKLNVVFDRTYARETAYQLGVLRNMMRGVHKSTTSSNLKRALETSDASLLQSAESFEAFAGSN